MKKTNYQCVHCEKRFFLESRYLNHSCKEMKRNKLFSEPVGQAAWIYYQKWMRSQGKVVSNSRSFIHSRFFNAFIVFAEFVKGLKIPDVDAYISIAKDYNLPPSMWTNEQVHALYLEHLDKKVSPKRHAEITINTLFNYAEDNEVDVSKVFEVITPNDLIKLVRARRISPWILLNSCKFGDFFVNRTNTEQRIILETLIRPSFWQEKFTENPEIVEQMKTYVDELRI